MKIDGRGACCFSQPQQRGCDVFFKELDNLACNLSIRTQRLHRVNIHALWLQVNEIIYGAAEAERHVLADQFHTGCLVRRGPSMNRFRQEFALLCRITALASGSSWRVRSQNFLRFTASHTEPRIFHYSVMVSHPAKSLSLGRKISSMLAAQSLALFLQTALLQLSDIE